MIQNTELKNKVILISGGSGSVGSQLVETLLKTNCHSVRVLSNNEYELYLLEKRYCNNPKIRLFLGDVRDKDRLKIAAKDAHIVFHAAALKHVPLCETNPFDAVQTNVIGTQNMIEASIYSNVEKFVFISTDKAANPQSTMGATKLLAERLTISAMSYRGKTKTITYCVRFGNVLGTKGSVVDLFYNQVKNKIPVTITDKSMTRFAMTSTAAIDLILNTLGIAEGGEIFVLKMKSLRIIDLAKSMIELKGTPNHKITEIGIRPGEKLHEELITKDEIVRTKELKNMYVIPSYNSKKYDKLPKIKSVYSSESSPLMLLDEIKKNLTRLKFEEFLL